MNNIKISIIIPIYNTAKYLEQCLESIINQTLKEIEIICIDDGSTDNSLEILKNYQQKDFRITILTQNHKKQGAARNYGISVTKGEYIGFVDSDDWCEPDMFEKLYKRANETNSDITMCPVTTYNDNHSNTFSKSNTYANLDIFPIEYFNKVFSPNDTLNFFFDICAYPVNKIYKADFIKSYNLQFAEDIYFEDIIFFYDIWFKAKKISLIHDFCYIYRMYSESSSSFCNDVNKLDIIKSLKLRQKKLIENKVYKVLKKDFLKYKRKTLLYWYDKIKDRNIKFLYFILMIVEMPSCLLKPINIFFKELFLLRELFINRNKRIVFWGSSVFLEDFIRKYHINNKNIIGIIDKNPVKQGSKIGQYMCYQPEKLKELNADIVIISILNFSKSNQQNIQKYIKKEDIINDIIIKNI